MATKSEKPGKVLFYLFGVCEVLVGLLFVLLSLMMLVLPKFAPANQSVPMPTMWPLSILYFIMASCIIALGVGTILAKRWARKIMLIFSWFGLSAGLFSMIFFIFFMGSFFDKSLNASGHLTPQAITAMKISVMAMMGFFYFVLPGICVLFYGSKYASATVEFYDPKENWMDACPTPVFAVSLFSAFGVFGTGVMLSMIGVNHALFGLSFPIWVIVPIVLAIMAALIYISTGFYHLEMKAWWVALTLVILGSALSFFWFKMMDPMAMYQQMKVPQEQIDLMKKTGMLDMYKSMANICWVMLTPYLGYLIFIRKYFLKK